MWCPPLFRDQLRDISWGGLRMGELLSRQLGKLKVLQVIFPMAQERYHQCWITKMDVWLYTGEYDTLTELLRASLALPPQSVWTSKSRLLHQSLDLWCFWGRFKMQNKQTNRTDKLKKKIKTTSFCKIITIIKKICYDTTNLQAWSRKFPCNSFPSVKWKTTLIWTCLPLWAMKERKEIDFNIWHRI